MKTLILITVLACSSLARAELLDREGLLRAVSGSGDLAEWTARNGLDLPKLVENCLDGKDPASQLKAWKLLVYFLYSFGADGAAGEDLSAIGPSLSKLVDDPELLRIVAGIPEEHWESIPFGLGWRFNYQALGDAEKSRLQKAHPKAVRAIEREIERSRARKGRPAGTDQSTKASEPAPGGNHQPNQKAEVHSR